METKKLIAFPKWLEGIGRSRIWGWRMRKQGLPVRTLNGKPYAVVPDADLWLLDKSTPEPAAPICSNRKEVANAA